MNRKLASLLISLLILSILLGTSNLTIPKAHAAVIGVVCLADPSFFTTGPPPQACPPAPVVFTGPNSPNNQLKIALNINDTDTAIGFDITLKADHTILKPADADLTGSVLFGQSPGVKCIGGVEKIVGGIACQPTDTADTIHFQVIGNTPFAGSQKLFTATFNVTTTRTGGINIGFQRGCGTAQAQTSVPPDFCITMVNGSLTPTPETLQQASFSDQPGFAISAIPTSLALNRNSTQQANIGLASVLKFNGTVTVTTGVSPSGLGANVSPTNVKLNVTLGGVNSTILTVDATRTVAGLYLVTVTGTSGSTVLSVLIPVNVADFGIAANPASLSLNPGASSTSRVTLTSVNGYTGSINITTTQTPTTGLTVACAPSTKIQLNPSQNKFTGTSTCTFTAQTVAVYTVNINATDGSLAHLVKVTVNVVLQNFVISAFPATIHVPVGGSNSTTIIIASFAGFAGTVSLAASTTGGLTATLASKLNLLANGANETLLTVNAGPSAILGSHIISIGGVSGQLSNNANVTVLVASDFSITASPTSFTLNAGFSTKSNITLTNLGNLVGDVTLTAQSSPSGLTTSLNSTKIALTLTTRKAAILTINAPNGTSPGTYTILLTGQTGSIIHTASITVNVSLHDVRVVTVGISTTATTVGTKVTFNIVVQNVGSQAENVTVNALVGSLTVAAANITLNAGEARAVTLTWDTSGFTPGNYALGGKVLSVPGEANTSNNIEMNAATITLAAPQASGLTQGTLVLVAIAAVVVAAAVIGILLLIRRKSPAQTVQ